MQSKSEGAGLAEGDVEMHQNSLSSIPRGQDGPSELSQIEARGWVFVPHPHPALLSWVGAAPRKGLTLDEAAPFTQGCSWGVGEPRQSPPQVQSPALQLASTVV